MAWTLLVVSLLPLVLGTGQTTPDLDECRDDNSLGCHVPPQRALLQRKQVEAKISQVVHEKVTAKSTIDTPGTLPEESALLDLNFSRIAGGKRAIVSFTHMGRRFEHNMTAVNLYSHGARLLRHTDKGEVPIVLGPPSAYASRTAGSWASIVVQEDGSITGLFETDGHVLRIKPAEKPKVTGQKYFVNMLTLSHPARVPDAVANASSEGVAVVQVDNSSATKTSNSTAHEIAIDNDPTGHFGHEVSKRAEKELAARAHMQAATHDASWTGQRWWGQCYPGDDNLHRFTLNVIADEDFYRDHGSQTRARLEEAVVEASFIYEKQMNIRLEISYLMIYESAVGAPSFAVGCANDHDSDKLMMGKLDQLVRDQQEYYHFQAATHLFTGCGVGYGTVGLAYIGTICELDGYNAGVNQFTHQGGWLVFAHELGHNFGAHHSFEHGQGSTGGVMDYGDGKLQGEYQFNSRFRKTEICQVLTRVGNCYGKFTRDWGGTPGNCRDTPGYTDKYGFKCSHWRGHNCRTYSSWWYRYSADELLSVSRNCQISCGHCTS